MAAALGFPLQCSVLCRPGTGATAGAGLAPRQVLPCGAPRAHKRASTQRCQPRGAMKDWRDARGWGKPEGGEGAGGLNPFAQRLEKAWSIRKQPVPVACESCAAEGMRECEWCQGSGYFVLGDKMLCQVPSRNTQCLICHGQGTVRCADCLGTGFRARWLEPRNK